MGANASVDSRVFQAIVEQCTDAVIFSDREGTIRIWNRGAEQVFGFAAAEALGRSLDIIIPERLRAAHWEGFRRAAEAGRTKYAGKAMTTRAVHKDGSTLYVDLSFGLVDGAGGGLAGVFAIGRDGTERYLADRNLRARVRELEQAPAQSSGG